MIQELTYHRFVCDRCGEVGTEAEYIQGEQIAAEESLEEAAIEAGWTVNTEHDLCPACTKKEDEYDGGDEDPEPHGPADTQHEQQESLRYKR
jgi:hypothetical protein